MVTHYTCGVTHFFFYSSVSAGAAFDPSADFGAAGFFGASFFLEKAEWSFFPFQYRHLVYFRIVFQIIGKSQQQYLPLFFKQD